MKPLNPRQMKFVTEYMKDANGARAAIAAGYSEKTARGAAYHLLHEAPAVIDAIDKARKAVQAKAQYNLQSAMDEAQEAIVFARETENANAYVKAVELRSKLNGLLVEKVDVRQSGLNIIIEGFTSPAIPTTFRPVNEEDDDVDPFS